MNSIYKACDIRGKYPSEINEEIVHLIGKAVGTLYKSKPIVVGGDVRYSTPSIKNSLIEGLISTGCNVIDIGIVPTPAFYHTLDVIDNNCAGVMVTASHNPPNYNGLKIAPGKLPITELEIQEVKHLTISQNFDLGNGKLDSFNITPIYENWIIEQGRSILKSSPKTLRVVVDCGNGCFSEIAPRVVNELGIENIPLFCAIDSQFPNRSPNSADPKNLQKLAICVVNEKAHLGIAFDGDGDRVSFVDENGEILSADESISIIASHKRNPVRSGDKVVLDIKCSSAVSDTICALNAVPILEKSGHTYIKRRMINENASFGGEISGHFFYRELGGGDDGLYSAIIMIDIAARLGGLSKIKSNIPHYYTTPDIRVMIDPNPNILNLIASHFPEDRVSRLDGVRVVFDNGWALARISVTEPVMTFRFESKCKGCIEKIIDEFLESVPHVCERVKSQYATLQNDENINPGEVY